jgi:ribosomal-protein-alanine N-acetyltransferase
MSNRLYLRAFEYEDLKFLNMLRNDDSFFALTTGNKYYISSERDKKWIEDKIFNNYNQLYLMLCTI